VAGVGIVGDLVGLHTQPVLADHFEHRPFLVGGRVTPLDRGVAALVVDHRTDAAPLGRRLCLR